MPAPPSDFAAWTLQDALARFPERIQAVLGTGADATGGAYEANRRYVEDGDHWQDGTAWPVAYDSRIHAAQLARIRPMFAPIPLLGQAVRRQGDGLLGREATIAAVPVTPAGQDGQASEAQKKAAAEGVAALAVWWDAVHLWEHVRRVHDRAAWAGWGTLRTRLLPSAYQTDAQGNSTGRLRSGLSFAEAITHVALSAPLPRDGMLYVDPDTERVAAIIRVSETPEGSTSAQDAAELWYRDRTGRVVRRILHADNTAEDVTVPAGAELPLQEVTAPPLVSSALRGQQRQVDFANSRVGRVVEMDSAREMFGVDLQPPSAWSTTPPSDGPAPEPVVDANGTSWYPVPVPLESGPGLFPFLSSATIPGGDGQDDQALRGSITALQPVDPEYLTKAVDVQEARFHRCVDQAHLVAGDAVASGESKRQSRAGFSKRLQAYKGPVEAAVPGALTSAMRLALLMTREGDPMHAFAKDFRLSCTLHIDTGPLTAEERKQALEEWERGVLPFADLLASLGIEDTPDAVRQRILADPMAAAKMLGKVLEVAVQIRDGFSLPAAVAYVEDTGLASPRLLAALKQQDAPEGLEQ